MSETRTAPEGDIRCASGLMDCLLLVARVEGMNPSKVAIASGLPLDQGELRPELFVRAANRAGLAAILLDRELKNIPQAVLPAILLTRDGKAVVLESVDKRLGVAVLIDTDSRERCQVDLNTLEQVYTGHVFYLRKMHQFDSRTPRIYGDKKQHWFWGVIKSSRSIYRDVLLASFLINLFVLAQPLFVMNVYDRVVPNNAVETLWALAIGVLIVYLFDLVLKILRSYLVELAAKRSDVILSAQLLEKVLNLKMASRPNSTGAFASRLHDFDTLRNFITSSTILALVDLPFVALFLAFIWYLGGWLFLIPALLIPVGILLAYRAQHKLRPSVEKVIRGSARKNATLIENLVGIESVKTLGCEGQVQSNWEQSVGYVAQWSLNSRVTSNATMMSVQWLQHLAMVAMVAGGVYLIADQNLTLGGLIACVILNGRAMAPLGQIANLLISYDHAEATLKSLDEVMKLPEEREAGKEYLHHPVLKGDLQFDKISFRYPEQPVAAIQNLSATLKAGEKVAIIGRIGSGKSTLARLLLRLYDPNEGAIKADGFDLQQLDPADIRNNICYIAQDAQLFFGTVRDNITMGMESVEDADVVAAATNAGIIDFINAHPLGFNMPIGERGETLSGGQRSAIALSRAFLRSPPVVIMDEPTASMDQGTETQVKEKIRTHFAEKSLIIITHKTSMLDLVDRLIVMDKGQIVADGPKESVLQALKQGRVRGRTA